MTAPTDLRATLRDAAKLLRDPVLRCDPGVARAVADHIDKILADAPPTVAELLPMVDATHDVRWEANGEEHRAIDGGDGQIHFQWRTGDGSRWRDHIVNHADLTAPARLVEVA